MKPFSNLLRSATMLLASLAVLSGCGGGGSGSATTGTGTLNVALTDNPACGYDHVYITVDKVRVHQSASAEEGDAGWHEIVLNPARRIDLLELTNGVLEALGQTALPAGTYTQMRLVLASNGTTPMANAVTPTGSSETALTTPSGQQTGIKMNVNITVAPDKVADFVIDFDACKSVVKAGNSGQYLLKPVVTGHVVLSDAGQRIVGYLDTATLGAATLVSAQSGGVAVKSTPPDATGKFVLYPVPAGTYNLVITSTGKATAVMTGVPVVTSQYTCIGSRGLTCNDNKVFMAMVDSGTNDAFGIATLDGSPADTGATVRALQTLYSGPTVEVAGMPVDAVKGEYRFTLPTGSPQIAAYVANSSVITFAPDSADANLTAAGKYTLEAKIEGLTTQTTPINLLLPYTGTNFTFVTPPPAP